jgi:hypothetical protein
MMNQTPTITEEEKILRRIPLEIIILSFVIALASIFLFNLLTALFILAGGAFSALSFTWLKTSISKLFFLQNGDRHLYVKKGDRHLKEEEPVPFFDKKKALRSALVLYGIRIVLIIAIFFIIIFFFSRNIIAFIAGFSTVVPVFLVEAIVALSRMKKWKN